MSILDNLPHLATAYRRTRTKDSTVGGFRDTWTKVFADRACWIQPLTSNEANWWQQKSVQATHKVYFVEDPALDTDAKLTISGVDYEVRYYSHPDATLVRGIAWKVVVELMK